MFVLFASVALAHETPDRVSTWREAIDWDLAGGEASEWLSDYLAVDTVAPPGNEMDGVRFLQGLLDAEGIGSTVIDHGDNRGSLIARIEGDGSAEPLCLLSHIDVVPAELENWTFDPLSGKIEDGIIYGRGALDMKGMGIVELASMVHLARLEVPLARDVVLVAVADEEVDGLGMQSIVHDHWDEVGCSHMINEGGLGIIDGLLDGQTLHAISVAEKGTLWLRMIAEGPAGHGSKIEAGEAPGRLVEAMDLVERKYKPKIVIAETYYELFDNVGRQHGGIVGAVLRSRFLVNTIVRGKLKAEPTTMATLTDSVHLTGMSGASSPNVVPSEVWAQYDARLLPGTDPDDVLAELEHITRKLEGIRWEVLQAQRANGSPWDDPFYERIAHYAVEGRPEAAAGPVLSPGFTDSIFARPLGVRAYGYVPFELTRKNAYTMHSHNERVSTANVQEGTRRMFSIVLDFAGTDTAPPDEVTTALRKLSAISKAEDEEGLGAELAARKALEKALGASPAAAVVARYNRARLETWADSNGLPAASLLGDDGTAALWALVEADLGLADRLLGAMAPLLESDGIDRTRYARLVDAVRVEAGQAGLYGTSGDCAEVEHPEHLDARRADMGLPSCQTP